MFTSQTPRAQLSKQLAQQLFDPTPPEAPTAALPGSAEKMRIMIERANEGKGLWHPSDRKWSDPVDEQPETRKVEPFVFALTLNDLFQG